VKLIENVEIVRHFIYCWLVVVILFCFAVDLHNSLFKKNTFFYAFDSGNDSLVGYVLKPAKNALKKVALPRGFVSSWSFTDPGIWGW